MDQRLKAFIVISTISVIIYVLYLMTSNSENSFLLPSGGRNSANQKLMVVDQSTGDITFVNKSLAGINKNFTDKDSEIVDALKRILGENLLGDTDGFVKTLKDFKNTVPETYATKSYVTTELAKKQQKGSYLTTSSTVIRSGDKISIAHKDDKGCGSKGCKAMINFKKQGDDKTGDDMDTGWNDADMKFGDGRTTEIKIHKV